MSKAYETDQVQDSAAPGAATSTEQTYGLPPSIYGRLSKLGPGDAEALHALLVDYPVLHQHILSAAVSINRLGNAAVQRAIAMTPHSQAPAASSTKDFAPGGTFDLEGGPPSAAAVADSERTKDYRPGGDLALEGGPPSVAAVADSQRTKDYRPGGDLALEGGPPSAAAVADSERTKDYRPGGEFALEGGVSAHKPQAAEPAWHASARRYNAEHSTNSEEFNELTNMVCATGEGANTLDPKEVATWQRVNGLVADGKVGPHTLAAARASRARGSTAIATATPAAADARPPV